MTEDLEGGETICDSVVRSLKNVILWLKKCLKYTYISNGCIILCDCNFYIPWNAITCKAIT